MLMEQISSSDSCGLRRWRMLTAVDQAFLTQRVKNIKTQKWKKTLKEKLKFAFLSPERGEQLDISEEIIHISFLLTNIFTESIRKRGRKNIEKRLGQTFRKCRWDDFRDASVSPPSTFDPLQNFFWCRWLFLRSLSSTSSYPVSNFWPHEYRDLPGSFFQSQILNSYTPPYLIGFSNCIHCTYFQVLTKSVPFPFFCVLFDSNRHKTATPVPLKWNDKFM